MRTLGVGGAQKAWARWASNSCPVYRCRASASLRRSRAKRARVAGVLWWGRAAAAKFHLTTGSQHIVNAQHGIAAVGQHQSPDAGLLHLFQHSLGVTAQVGVGAALRAGKTFRQRIQRREGGPIPGKQLQRGVFAGIINRFAHTSASCLLCSISRKASSRVAVWPSIVLARSQPSPSSSSTG